MVKIIRNSDGTQDIVQITANILLEGDIMDGAFYTGDNSNVVPTDTCKNTVYVLGKMHDFCSIESFGIIICEHFLKSYPDQVQKVSVELLKDRWDRVVVPDSKGAMRQHAHAFKRVGPAVPYTKVVGTKSRHMPAVMSVASGIRGYTVLKTTQSGFLDFHQCSNTSLPQEDDRILGTSFDVEWKYCPGQVRAKNLQYNKISQSVEDSLVRTLVGPADTGHYSKSVQETLYNMGHNVLEAESAITAVSEVPCVVFASSNSHSFCCF
jgi:urate oxidase